MEHDLAERPILCKQESAFSCPDACERMDCKEPNLYISISLLDLVALALDRPDYDGFRRVCFEYRLSI
jgi:hypothetical protein